MGEVVAALRPWVDGNGGKGSLLWLWCPPCDDSHAIEVSEPSRRWQWDGNLETPTVSPSIRVGGVQWEVGSPFHKPRHNVAAGGPITCHSFLKEGRWEFLSDCTHDLAGQTVEMVPLPESLRNAGGGQVDRTEESNG